MWQTKWKTLRLKTKPFGLVNARLANSDTWIEEQHTSPSWAFPGDRHSDSSQDVKNIKTHFIRSLPLPVLSTGRQVCSVPKPLGGPKQNLIWGPPPTTADSPLLDNYWHKCHTVMLHYKLYTQCNTVKDYELLFPWAQMHKNPLYLICTKVGANGARGVSMVFNFSLHFKQMALLCVSRLCNMT